MNVLPGTLLAHRFEVTGPDGEAMDRATGSEVRVVALGVPSSAARSHIEDRLSALRRIEHRGAAVPEGPWPLADGGWLVVHARLGPTLGHQRAPLGPRSAVEIGIDVADALMAAHRVGVVHGDVGPDTVHLNDDGALLTGFLRDEEVVRAGVTAPEVSVGGPAGVPADLYGLGVVLHQALHGHLPFEGGWAALGDQQARPQIRGPRGLATLIRALLDPDPAKRPANAAVVRTALYRLREDPQRWVTVSRFKTPSIRWSRAWLVHGIDPGTGAPAIVRADLPRSSARALMARLRAEGWDVHVAQEAFGGRDVLWILLMGTIGGFFVPMLGFVPALLMAGVWRSRRVDANLRQALPELRAAVPAPAADVVHHTAIVVGGLLLAAAIALVVWPAAAAVPAGLLAVWLLLARSRRPVHEVARGQRVQVALGRVRDALELHALPLDQALGIEGRVDALEGAWQVGDLDTTQILAELEELGKQVLGSQPMGSRSEPHPALTALRGRDAAPRLETT